MSEDLKPIEVDGFADLDSFLDDDTFALPVGGKIYSIPDVDGETGLRLARQLDTAVAAAKGNKRKALAALDDAPDDEQRDLFQVCLGPVLDELIADGVKWNKIRHIGITAYIYHASGIKAAQKYWVEGVRAGEAKTPAGNRASRRASSAAAKSAR